MLLSLVVTWPLAAHLDATLFGWAGDMQGSVAASWARLHGFLDGSVNPLYCAPYGMPISHHNVQPLYGTLYFLSAKVFGELAGHNLFVLLSFPLSAFAMFLFLNYVLDDAVAAFLGGFIFGFCPAAVMHAAAGHLSFSMNPTLPLFLFALFRHRENRSWRSALFIGASYVAVLFMSTYWGLFSAYVGMFFVAYDVWVAQLEQRRAALLSYVPALIGVAAIALAWFYPVIHFQEVSTPQVLQQAGRVRPLKEVIMLSAFPWDYVLPSINHPLFGRLVEPFARNFLHGSNLFEQTLYQGIVPLALLVAGLLAWKRQQLSASHRRLFLLFMAAAAWMTWASAPFCIPLKSFNIPLTIGYFTYQVAPMFRAMARAGLFVSLFVACASAVVIAHKRRSWSPRRGAVISGLLLLALVVDFSTTAPAFTPRFTTPEVYSWLAEQPKDTLIAEYPMMAGDTPSFYQYLFWQRVHGKRTVNGAVPFLPQAWQLYERARDLNDPAAIAALREAGVRYVIVHDRGYIEGRIPEPIKRYYPLDIATEMYDHGHAPKPALPIAGRFGHDVVYTL